MQERLQLLVYSLVLGALLLLVAGWAGAIVLYDLGLLVLLGAAVSLVSGSVLTCLAFLVIPPAFATLSGAWTVSLVALPLLAQALARRPGILILVAPIVGAATGGAVMMWQIASIPAAGRLQVEFGLRMVLAGVFAGFIVGAIFGRQIGHYLLRRS